jgi:PAS domain S-box-containing protein
VRNLGALEGMMLQLSGQERKLAKGELIVSKTNLKGHITYANDIFLEIADFSLSEILNKPHSIIRHKMMPRCVYQLMWEYLQAGREIFAYVVNATKYGDYYWVFAHVTPSMNEHGKVTSYHSNRRGPSEQAIQVVSALYDSLLKEEKSQSNRKEGQKAGYALLIKTLQEKGVDYDEFILSL